MKGRRLGMQGRAIQDPALRSCMDRHCPVFSKAVARVLRVARRSVKHSIFKDTAADLFHGSCVHRHGALNRFFSLLEVHVCGSPEAEGCFDARFSEYMYVFFVICALGLAFSSLRAVGACSTFFFCVCSGCMFHRFLCTALQRLTPSDVNGAQLC